MLLKNNNIGVKRVFEKLYKENKVKNIYTLISIFLTSLLLTSVSVVGFNMYNSNKSFLEATKEVQYIQTNELVPIVFIILLVMFSGYLIIYNIFYISIIREIRLYGQLKIIGFTFKQIKSLVHKWAMKLTFFALPFALLFGGVIGSFLTPIILGETFLADYIITTFNMIPYCIGAIFTFLTVYIAVSKPAKIAAKTTPIQAINYNSSDLVKINKKSSKVKKSTKGAKIKKMALSNMLKNKTKIVIYSLSIALSSTLVVFAMVVGVGLDVEEHARRYMMSDINIGNMTHPYENKFDNEILKEIKSITGVKEVIENKIVVSYAPWGGIETNIELIRNEGINKEFNMYEDSWKMIKGNDFIQTSVAGILSKNLEKNIERFKIIDGKINEEEFKTGSYVIIKRDNKELEDGLKAGDSIELDFRVTGKNGEVKNIKNKFKVMAVVTEKDENYTSSALGTITLEEEKLIELFGVENTDVGTVLINTEEGKAIEVEKEITKIAQGKPLRINSVNGWLEGVANMKASILLASGIVSIIFGLIAVINVLNTTISDLIIRKREFGMLEAIGMTKKEQIKLLNYEGMYKMLLIGVIIVPLSFIAAMMAPMMVPIYGGFNLGAYILTVSSVLFVIAIIVIFIPRYVFKNIIRNESVIERIKED
ncbi:MAG: FtsX-like permease family protein [Sarcina sp.]